MSKSIPISQGYWGFRCAGCREFHGNATPSLWPPGGSEERQATEVVTMKRSLEALIYCEPNVQGHFENQEMRNKDDVELYSECNATSLNNIGDAYITFMAR